MTYWIRLPGEGRWRVVSDVMFLSTLEHMTRYPDQCEGCKVAIVGVKKLEAA